MGSVTSCRRFRENRLSQKKLLEGDGAVRDCQLMSGRFRSPRMTICGFFNKNWLKASITFARWHSGL